MNTDKIQYAKGNIGNGEIVKNFLLPTSEVVKMENNIKVTIYLKKSSVDFFKEIAKNNYVQYQRVIQSLLDSYANKHIK